MTASIAYAYNSVVELSSLQKSCYVVIKLLFILLIVAATQPNSVE